MDKPTTREDLINTITKTIHDDHTTCAKCMIILKRNYKEDFDKIVKYIKELLDEQNNECIKK
jgi:hypothetical protein